MTSIQLREEIAAELDYLRTLVIEITALNQGKYLEKTILSVLDQGYPNLEYIIIIDGGSSDEQVEIIRKYADSLTYWESEPDRGQSHAINKGFELATGEIFGWLNSDDWYKKGYCGVDLNRATRGEKYGYSSKHRKTCHGTLSGSQAGSV